MGNRWPMVKKGSVVNSCAKRLPEVHVQLDWFSVVIDSFKPAKASGVFTPQEECQESFRLPWCATQSCSLANC